ncbi:hypothetical protein ABIB40_002731 [Pedobacter sp. UYP30]
MVETSESSSCKIIACVPGPNVKNMMIHDLLLINHSNGSIISDLPKIFENLKCHLESTVFSEEPTGFGLYIRHAKNIKLKNSFCKMLLAL